MIDPETPEPPSTSLHVQRAVRGDRESLAWLASRFGPFVENQVRLRVGRAIPAEDQEDIAADVWVTVLQRIQDIEPRDGRYAPVLVRFLGSTVLNRSNRFLRDRIRKRNRAATPNDPNYAEPDEFARTTRGVLTRIATNDLVEQIRTCLDSMTEAKQDVLVLRLLEQRSNEEIAEILKMPANTIAVRYRRAMDELRRKLPADAFREIRESCKQTPRSSDS